MKMLITTVALLSASIAGAQTITYTGAACTRHSSGVTASCTLAAPASVGDLEIVTSKSSSNTASVRAVLTFSRSASCAKGTQVIAPGVGTWQPNGAGHFVTTMFACIVSNAGAASPVVTWFGTDATFTDIKVATYHTTTSWASELVDKVATNIATQSSTSCSTGVTAATDNSHDLVVAVCDNYNAQQSWNALAGFTTRPASSTDTAGWYDTTVSSRGTQTANIPLSSSDLGVGMTAAFAANSSQANASAGLKPLPF
jgi:hypothetical protein